MRRRDPCRPPRRAHRGRFAPTDPLDLVRRINRRVLKTNRSCLSKAGKSRRRRARRSAAPESPSSRARFAHGHDAWTVRDESTNGGRRVGAAHDGGIFRRQPPIALNASTGLVLDLQLGKRIERRTQAATGADSQDRGHNNRRNCRDGENFKEEKHAHRQ